MTGHSGDHGAMVLRNTPLTYLGRLWCWLVVVVLIIGSALGVVIAFQRRDWPLGLTAIGAGAIGALYARAAMLGRPLRGWWH